MMARLEMRSFYRFLIGLGRAALGPAYLFVLGFAARVGPWPGSLGRPAGFALSALALAAGIVGVARMLFRPGGWIETELHAPAAVGRQAWRTSLFVAAAALVLLLPKALLERGLIAPGDRPVAAPATCRLLGIGFEVVVWLAAAWLLRRKSAAVEWLWVDRQSRGWLARHHGPTTWLVLAAIGAIIGLDARGYGASARRLAAAGGQSLLVLAVARGSYRLILRVIEHHGWRWTPSSQGYGDAAEGADRPDELPRRLRALTARVVPILAAIALAWVWEMDLALFHVFGRAPLWPLHPGADATGIVTVGDLTKALVVAASTAAAWRHLGAFFALVVYPRMRDDPGVRFAVLTLCRYLILGVGALATLSALHLGSKEVGVVVAALGVGLGFGLQEIVSNFVSGIILLLERPIRVGDVVTVNGTTGRVDRINIRATTIINGDNQSMIVPNRAFITGDLVNWTHKDKVVKFTIRIGVAYGSDPDRVADLLLTIARDDPDALKNPLPVAMMEEFGDSALKFALSVHVPEPSLIGRVRHRLSGEIQRRLEAAGIDIPVPIYELRVRADDRSPRELEPLRIHPASPTPPAAHHAPATAEETPVNRCVDE
jgi:potassium efflux system protein